MNIGIVSPSEIALRRFLPALKKISGTEFAGVAVASRSERIIREQPEGECVSSKNQSIALSTDAYAATLKRSLEKAKKFTAIYGGKIFESYESMVSAPDIDAVYIPLIPALHFKWAKKALENGKHVMLEKPSVMYAHEARELARLAEEKKPALHENYMFVYHRQTEDIKAVIASGELGDIRLYRAAFGFPKKESDDFRYVKALGGGALMDAGGYTIRCASEFLGETARIAYARLNYTDGYEVDMYGSAAMVNDKDVTAQLAFGMDNSYKCELEIWGSRGCLICDRIFTPPDSFVPGARLKTANGEKLLELSPDDAFEKSIKHFMSCIADENLRKKGYKDFVRQAELVDDFRTFAQKDREIRNA